ncbi:MAG TPA: hypothetical protein VM142_00070 [Acidimicrobiales bacterium]|nr:hypothetical protein [Acidimicrobiales bacterium]
MTETSDHPGAPLPSAPKAPARRGRRGRRTGLVLVLALLLAAVSSVFLVEDETGTNGGGGPKLSGNQALLSGKVVDAQTKKPLPGARLLIDQEGGRLSVVADGKGTFQQVINASRPIGFTADAPGHQGTAGFGKLCPGERRQLDLELPPAGNRSAPPAPLVLKGDC